MSLAQAIRNVSRERGFARVPQQSSASCPFSACPPATAWRYFATLPIASAVTADLSL
jgi:hypothetical protein